MDTVVTGMGANITQGITTVLGGAGSLVDALFTTEGELSALAIFIGLSVGASLVMLGVKVVKSLAWGV